MTSMGDMESQSSNNMVTEINTSSSLSISSEHQSQSLNITAHTILTRFHAGFFRITLSLGAQALLWKALSELTTKDSRAVRLVSSLLSSKANHFLWYLAFGTLALLSLFYILRCFFCYEIVRAEFRHNVGVNYLFFPWISWLLLLQSAPASLLVQNTALYPIFWWVFAVPLLVLDVKVYGQWFTTDKRFLSLMANPTSQLSVIGNFAGARAAALMGWKESALCMFSLGMVHYFVLFVTLFQQLTGRRRRRPHLPVVLRPAFSLFFAAPSMASLAWSSISGTFDTAARMLFFLSIFLFTSLVCRPALFKRSMRRFSVAWWTYSFPLSFLALASMEYAKEFRTQSAVGLMLGLSSASALVFNGLMLLTGIKIDSVLHGHDPTLTSYKHKASNMKQQASS